MKEHFDKTNDGIDVSIFTISNKKGMKASIIEYGATVTSIIVPDRSGSLVDVVLGYDTLAEYENNSFFFGAICGRNANRIAGGKYTIDGVTYPLLINDNDNNLHSGPKGFNKIVWKGEEVDESTVKFSYISPDMENGFPGQMETVITYHITEDNRFEMKFEAETDKPTICNLASHTYDNLDGHDAGSIEHLLLKLYSSKITPVSDFQAIPTGEEMDVTGTAFDFRTPKLIGKDIDADDEQLAFVGGYDHNFVMDGTPGELRPFATFSS
nr:galactose mutarotase [Eubacterium sp.]